MSIKKSFKQLTVAAVAAMGLTLSHGAAADVFAQEVVTATVPVTVNVAATVSITPPDGLAGAAGVSAEVPAGATPTTLTITLAGGQVPVSHRAAARGAAPVVMTHSRGNVSMRLSPQQYGKADISLFAVNGRRVLKGKADAAQAGLKLSRGNVAAGVYLLSVKGTQGNAYSHRLIHNGGRLNINVAFDASGMAPRLAKEAAYGEWTIRAWVGAGGYSDASLTFTPVPGENPLQAITLIPAEPLETLEMPDGKKWTTRNVNVLTASSWCYNDSSEYCDKYGRLYTWDAANEACASLGNGWGLPTDDDWTALTEAAGGAAAGKNLKSATGWTDHATATGIDQYGFGALPGGYRSGSSSISVGNNGQWWTGTENETSTSSAWRLEMNYNSENVGRGSYGKSYGYSVRCLWTPVAASGHTITFDANGGTVSTSTGTTGADGKLASLPEPARSGYTFDGWFSAATGARVTTSTEFPRNTIVYARWTSIGAVDPFEAVIMPDGKKWTKRNLNIHTASSWCYDDNPENCAKYGRLYTWDAANEACAVIGNGWRLPTDAEWTTLTNALVYSAGTKLKTSTGWTAHPNKLDGIDQYGFSALPGGYRSGSSSISVGNNGQWWTGTENETSTSSAWRWEMNSNNENAGRGSFGKSYGYSVRCLWTPVTASGHTITFNANGGTVSQSTGTTGADGRLTSLPEPARSGYTFAGWFNATTGARVTTNTEFPKNTIIYARWTSDVADPFEAVIMPDGKKWTKRNLNVLTASSWCYGDSTVSCVRYGRLYTWDAANEACASIGNGWRLPTDAEWTALTDTAIVYSPGTKLKSTTGWTAHPNKLDGIDQYGFSALPGGYRSGSSSISVGNNGQWWTGTENETSTSSAWRREMNYNSENVGRGSFGKSYGYSVRCLWTPVAETAHTITFNANGGTVSPSTGTTGTDGKLASLPNPTRSGYTFDGWFNATTGTQVTASTEFPRNTIIYARWTPTGGGIDPLETVVMPDGKTWTKRNLNVATEAGSSWCYGDSTQNCDRYGRLYTWQAAVDACAGLGTGWRLPTDAEWTALTNALVYNAGQKLKSTTAWTTHTNKLDGIDQYGFSALPGGYRSGSSSISVGNNGQWWTGTENETSTSSAWRWEMNYNNENAGRGSFGKSYGYSVRCLRD